MVFEIDQSLFALLMVQLFLLMRHGRAGAGFVLCSGTRLKQPSDKSDKGGNDQNIKHDFHEYGVTFNGGGAK